MPMIADTISDAERSKLGRIAEPEPERAAVQATVEALGWKDCDGSDTLQCMCGHIGAASEFLARRIASGRGPRVTLCRECATRR